MSIAESPIRANFPRRVPSGIRLTPKLVNQLSSRLNDVAAGLTVPGLTTGGLLFGTAQEHLITIEALREFDREDLDELRSAKVERLERAFEKSLAATRQDREFASLELVGWYSIRPAGLCNFSDTDIEFHNRHFRRISDVAMLLSPEPGAIAAGRVYTRSPYKPMSIEEHKNGSFQFPLRKQIGKAIEVAMAGASAGDDFVIYQVGEPQESQTGKEGLLAKLGWRRTKASPERPPVAERDRLAPQVSAPPRQPYSPEPEPIPAQTRPPSRPAAGVESTPVERGLNPNPAVWVPETKQALPDESSAPPLLPVPYREQANLPAVPSTPEVEPSKSANTWQWISAAVFFFAAGVNATLIYMQFSSKRPHMPVLLQRAPVANKGLNMRAEANGNTLTLTWNHSLPAVQAAQQGTLEIDDGSEHRSISLNAGQLADGTVWYKPTSNEVTFRLEIPTKQGPPLMETLRVLNASSVPPEVAAASAPQGGPETSGTQGATSSPGTTAGITDHGPENTLGASRANARAAEPYAPARPVNEVAPDLTHVGAITSNAPAQIAVGVSIDERGHVTDARIVDANPNVKNTALAAEAIAAAKQWTFDPAERYGAGVASTYTILFRFQPAVR